MIENEKMVGLLEELNLQDNFWNVLINFSTKDFEADAHKLLKFDLLPANLLLISLMGISEVGNHNCAFFFSESGEIYCISSTKTWGNALKPI